MPVLANSTPVQVPTGQMSPPLTVVLSSAAGGRAIQYQADPSREDLLTDVDPDVTSAEQILAVSNSKVAYVWITGEAGDTYEVY